MYCNEHSGSMDPPDPALNFLACILHRHFHWSHPDMKALAQVFTNIASYSLCSCLTDICKIFFPELGTSLFEITQSLFALEKTLILGANEQFKKKSEEG